MKKEINILRLLLLILTLSALSLISCVEVITDTPSTDTSESETNDTEIPLEEKIYSDNPETCPDISLPIRINTSLNANCTYTVPHFISVENEAYLTINEGVTLKFENNTGLYVGYSSGGGLQINGNEENKVTLTSAQQHKGAGDWNSLYFGVYTLNNSYVRHALIEYAGGGTSNSALGIKRDTVDNRIQILNTEIRNNFGGFKLENTRVDFRNNHIHSNVDFSMNLDIEALIEKDGDSNIHSSNIIQDNPIQIGLNINLPYPTGRIQ